jgi:sugar-specific transcriptional regulator TrmB
LEYQASEVQTLVDLGLNNNQAITYLSLAKFGPSSIEEIAKQSKMSFSATNITLNNLHKLGIVEKISKKPLLFKALSADKTLKFLMQRKTLSTNKTGNGSEVLLSNLVSGPTNQETCLDLIPKRDALLNRAIQAVYQAEESIDFVLSWDLFAESIYSVNPEIIKPNVTIRFIVEQPANLNDLAILKKLKKPINIRFIQTSPKALLGIYDKKDGIIIDDPVSDVNDTSAMCTNNQNVIVLAQTYFETLWHKSTDKPLQQNSN